MKRKGILIALMTFGLLVSMSAQESLTMDMALKIAEESSPKLKTSYLNLQKYKLIVYAQKASMKSNFSLDLSPIQYSKNRQFDSRLSQWYTNESFTTGGAFRMVQPIFFTDGKISLVNNFNWQNNKSEVGGASNINKAFKNRLYLQIDQPLFTYNTTKMKMQEIEYDYENARISYALQKLSTEKEISTQFYNVYMDQENLRIAKNEYDNAIKSYEIIKNKVDADLSAREELFQAEVNKSTAESTYKQNIVSLQNALDNFKKSLGLPLEKEIVVADSLSIKDITVDLLKAINHGMNSRLELRQREIKTRELDFALIRAEALNEFKGNLSLSLGLTGDDNKFSDIYRTPTTSPSISLTFSVPVFDWGEKKARIKAQRKTMDINKIDAKEEKIDIQLEIRRTWRNLDNLKRQIEIAKKTVNNAQYSYDLNLIKYREGDLSGMDINQFQTQLSSKKTQYTQRLINYRLELLNMKILSLYDFEKDAPIIPDLSEGN